MTERDWNKDMERVELSRDLHEKYGAIVADLDPKESLNEVLGYWLQQYAVEKERADKAEGLAEAYEATARAAGAALIESEEREKKLKEALEYEIELHVLRGSEGRRRELRELLASLYPDKEEES